MTQLYAQPYDISATGFFFETADDYAEKAKTNRNQFGDPVEEYEIQFIDGEAVDCALARVWEVNQANFAGFLDAVETWDDDQKHRYIIAVGECGYDHTTAVSSLQDLDIQIYLLPSLAGLAEEFVEEGLFGAVDERLARYLNYDAIGRDLAVDYSETRIAGKRIIYRCA